MKGSLLLLLLLLLREDDAPRLDEMAEEVPRLLDLPPRVCDGGPPFLALRAIIVSGN
jgi:hypothetical protein